MGSGFIVIRDVSGKNPPQMILAEDDCMVQTFATNTAVESFRIWILPGTVGCCEHLFDAHVLDAPSEPVAIDPVPVTQQVLGCRLPRKCFYDLLRRPQHLADALFRPKPAKAIHAGERIIENDDLLPDVRIKIAVASAAVSFWWAGWRK